MHRRKFVLGALSAGLLARGIYPIGLQAKTSQSIEDLRLGWRQFLAADARINTDITPLKRDPESWQSALPKDSFNVLFKEDTERAFTSPLNDEKREGLYICRACELPLFSSAMKYDSGTGWPSFFTSIPDHLATKTDYKLIWPRTEYHCVRCGGHQGHLFDDGPEPTNERWCNNGAALRFVPSKG